MTNILPIQTNKVLITQSMLDNLEYDKVIEKIGTMTPKQSNETKSIAMIIFHQSDIDAATYHLAKSLEDPINTCGIKSVFVQESCVEKFTEKLKYKLKSYTKEQLEKLNLKEAIDKSEEIVTRLNAKTLRPENSLSYCFTMVLDFPLEHFVAKGEPLPVVNLITFRTVKEAIALLSKESIYKSASIWCENQAVAYEVIAESPLHDYYLNCCNIAWAPIQQYITKGQPFALIENSYHYETLGVSGNQKNIVFPFGTSFAN